MDYREQYGVLIGEVAGGGLAPLIAALARGLKANNPIITTERT